MDCLIIDDDPLLCDLLEHFCSKIDQINSVTVSNNGFESINLINQNHFDVILLDYDLPDLTAKDILPLIDKNTAVIMITANKDFGYESYNYDQIIDFLVKPVEFSRFYQGITKVMSLRQPLATETNQLFIKDGNTLVGIKLNEILFIKSVGNYAELVLADKKIMTIMTLKELEKKLPPDFHRVHRSCIVNINMVERITNYDLVIGEHEISISSSHKADLMQKLKFLN